LGLGEEIFENLGGGGGVEKLKFKFQTFYPKIYLFSPKNDYFPTIQRRVGE